MASTKYDVFLSFRGADTRTKFTDHLYNALFRQGIPTFRDSEELEKGQDLSQLFAAIEKSTIAVVIISSNYASSTWCLREVAKIVECRNKSGLIVLPVFYDIEPTQVRKQSSEKFKESFDQHEQKFKEDEVESWRQALTEVATLVGWDLKDRLETTVIEDIVKCVDEKLKLKKNPEISNEDSKDFVGMDRVRKIELDLDIKGLDNVGVIGICGMPGVGKTMIAQEVFRRNWHHFEAKSFIANVGETRKKENGLLCILNQLYQDLLGSKDITMSDVPAERRKLRHKKVLIILDGVTELELILELVGRGGEELINWFGRGSRIIITTIDEKLLKDYEAKIHKVERLAENDARLLFFRTAFRKDLPQHAFADLSYKFVDLADGLPLAIVALGNLLLNRTLDAWKAELRTLEANNYTGYEKLFVILTVCINGLRSGAKDIFLDIACFFKGDDKKRAERIFESCGHNPVVNLNILLEKSLVTIVGGKLWMHDLLQDTGQKMVIGESKLLGNRSRLWHPKDAISVLKQAKGTGAVTGIFLSSPRRKPDNVQLKEKTFSKMDFLRLLKIKNVIVSGCVNDLSNELSFMEWHGFPSTSLPSNFEPEKLVELHLPQSQIKQLWEETPPLEMLVIMDLSDCKYLTSTPDFQSMPNLEILILKGCTGLSEVDLPIGDYLHKLILLNLEGCESLRSLSKGICSLRSLTTLILSGCSKLAKLPEKFGEMMKQLSELDLEGTAIKELPAASIKHLTGLIRLNLRDCKNLLSLPAIICSLTKLQVLNLSGCLKLDELPENMGSLVGLRELDASRSCIRRVPSSILNLKVLESLSFSGCGGLQLPASFSGLDSLTKLDLSYCKLSDGAIPADLDCLSSLDHLNLSGNSLVSVPESITKLSKLEVLLLNDCGRLRLLPHLPSSIQRVFARNCPLLGTYANKLTVWTSTATGFCFINSQTIEEHKLHRIPMTEQRLLRPRLQKFYEDIIYKGNGFEYITPHTEIPSWLDRQSEGPSIQVPLPPNYFDGELELMGFALCFVYEAQEHENMESTASNLPPVEAQEVKYSCNYSCCLSTCGGPDDDCPLLVCKLMDHDYVGSFRHWVYIAGGLFAERLNKRSVRAQVIIDRPGVEVKACGARLIYSGGVTEFVWNLNLRDEIPSHIRNLPSPNDEAQMNRSISLYDTRGKNKQFLDHDAGSSSRTSSSTQVSHQRLERPESNDQSNEQEQGTNSQLTQVAEGGCASDPRLLIEIEPHTSRDDSTSTKIVGDQLGTNVESFLDELFELGGEARTYDIGFLFSLRAILPWFTNQCIGNIIIPREESIGSSVTLSLPPELYNNSKWVGFALYVSFTLPPGVRHENLCGIKSFLYTSDRNLHFLHLLFDGEDNLKGSHRLLVIHMPRGQFEEQLNWGSNIIAQFVSSTPGVEIEMCGMRVVYEQDLKGLIQTITQCTIRSPLAVYNGNGRGHSIVADGNLSCLVAGLKVNLIKEAESSERRRSTLQEPLRDSKFISGQQIHLTIDAETPYIPLKNKDSIVKWKRNLEVLLQRFLTYTFGDLLISLRLDGIMTSFSSELFGIFLQKEIPEWFTPQDPSGSVVSELRRNLENGVNFMGLVVCAAFSVHASEADVHKYLDSGLHPQLKLRFQFAGSDLTFDGPMLSSPEIKFMWLYHRGFIWQLYLPRDFLKEVLRKDTLVKVTCGTDSISSKVWGIQKCSSRILYKQDLEKLKQTIVQCFTSFFDNEDIIRPYLVEDPGESCGTSPVETSGKSNDPDLIPFFIEIEPAASSTQITGQLRRNIETSLLVQLFQGDNASHYDYGFILSPRVGAVMPWFSHQSFLKVIYVTAPPDLYKDKKWVGFSLYVAFTQQSPDPDAEFFCVCRLFAFPENNVTSIIRWCPDQFSGSQRRLCFIHIPRARLPEQSNDSIILAAFDFYPPAAASVVEMCGFRVVYDKDVNGLIQTIAQSIITSPPPVFFSQDDKTHITPQGEIVAGITMATSLVGHSEAYIHPIRSILSPPAVPSQKLGKVELQMYTRGPFNQKVTSEWKRNFELLLRSFFRLHHLSIKLHLGREGAVANYENWLSNSYLFPQKEIPDWFTEISHTSTFVFPPLPDDLESDNNWMGFVICAAFSVHPHPTDVGNYKDSQLTSDVTCNFRWSSDSSQFISIRGDLVGVMPNTKFMWLSRREFIWLRFVHYGMFKKDMMDESHRQLEASFKSGSPAVAVQKCSLRILCKQDIQEYQQTLIQCFASLFDNLDHSQPYKEDDDSRHDEEPIHEDDQIDSVGTTRLSEDTQHETKTTLPVPQSETSGNSFNSFNSILFEPILYDNRSAVIFADFRGWEE